jgi:hypothetical protein
MCVINGHMYSMAGLLEGMNISICLKVFSSLFIDMYDTCRRQEHIVVVSFMEIDD